MPASQRHLLARPLLILTCLALPGVHPAAQEPAATAPTVAELISQAGTFETDGDFALALETYEDAAEQSRRELGLFNDELVSILGMLERTASAAGEYALAREYRDTALMTGWRALEETARNTGQAHGFDSREYLDAKLDLAHWLADQRGLPPDGNRYWSWMRESREVYVEILDLIDEHFDGDPEMTIWILRDMASIIGSALRDGGTPPTLGEPYVLVRAERTVKRAPDLDPQVAAAVMRDIGDWRLRNNSSRAEKAYREAWELLGDAANARELREAWFGEPEIVNTSARSSSYATPDMPGTAPGHVDLEFIVDVTGRVSDVEIVGAVPDWARWDEGARSAAVNSIAFSRFRPRIEDGVPVAAPGRYTWNFRYYTAAVDGD